jgi:hypothetical protein
VAFGRLTRADLVCLGAALVVSDAFIREIYAGQLGLLTALALVSALDARGRGRPALAGACLALASVKVVTLVPFLLLFHRKADVAAWVSFAAVCLVLCLAASRPGELPGRVSNMARRIDALSEPGRVNDYSFQGPRNESIIGFDHLVYRLGVRDRRTVRTLQYLLVAASGLWVAWQVLVARLPDGASCSLVALYSMVFLYHRDYDTLILTLPLVHCIGRACAEGGTAGRLFAACAVAIYLILYMNLPILVFLTAKSQELRPAGRLIQATLLPYATWLILLVAAGLVIAESMARRRTAPTLPA